MKVGRWLPWVYALPMIVFVVGIFAYPIATLFRYSLQNVATSAFMPSTFAGLNNFRYIFTDSLFATAPARMESMDTFLVYGKPVLGHRLGIAEIKPRIPSTPASPFGLETAKRYAEALGKL